MQCTDMPDPAMPYPDMVEEPPDLAHPDEFEYMGPHDPVKNRKHYEESTVHPYVDIGYSYPGLTNKYLRELDHADQLCDRFHPHLDPSELAKDDDGPGGMAPETTI